MVTNDPQGATAADAQRLRSIHPGIGRHRDDGDLVITVCDLADYGQVTTVDVTL